MSAAAANAPATNTGSGTSCDKCSRCCAFFGRYVCPWLTPDHAMRCDAGTLGAAALVLGVPHAIGIAGMYCGACCSGPAARLPPLEWFRQLRKPDWYPSVGVSGAVWATLTVCSGLSYLRILSTETPEPGECKCCSFKCCCTSLCPACCNEPEPAPGPAGDGVRRRRAAKAFLLQALAVNSLWSVALFGARSPVLSFVHTCLAIFLTGHAACAAYTFDRTAGLLQLPTAIWMWAEAAMGYALMRRNVCDVPNGRLNDGFFQWVDRVFERKAQ